MNVLPTAVKAEPQSASVAALAPTTSSSLSQLPKPAPEPPRPLNATTTSSSLAPPPLLPLPPSSGRPGAAIDSPAEDEEAKAKLELKREDQADPSSRDQRESGMEPTDEKEEAGASLGSASDSEATAVDASTAASSTASEEMDVEDDVKPMGKRARNATAQPSEGRSKGAPSPSAKPETRSKRQKRGGEAEAEEEVDIKPKQDPEDLADRDRRLELAHFPRVDRPSTGGSLLSISIFADSFFSTYPPDQPPEDLFKIKHFHREDLGGAPQATYSQGGPKTATEKRPFDSARVTIDPARNYGVKKAGEPFMGFMYLRGKIVDTSVFGLDPEGAMRDDPSPDWPYIRERWAYYGTYRNLWQGSLTQEDWDWAMMPAGFDKQTATMEQREAEASRDAFVNAMVEYGGDDPAKYTINQATLRAWNFAVTSIVGPKEDRKRSIRDEMDDHAESIEVGWVLWVYAGYDQEELEWITERRRIRREKPVEVKPKEGKAKVKGKIIKRKGTGNGKGKAVKGRKV